MATERIQRQIDRLLDEAEYALSESNWPLVRDRAGNVLAKVLAPVACAKISQRPEILLTRLQLAELLLEHYAKEVTRP